LLGVFPDPHVAPCQYPCHRARQLPDERFPARWLGSDDHLFYNDVSRHGIILGLALYELIGRES